MTPTQELTAPCAVTMLEPAEVGTGTLHPLELLYQTPAATPAIEWKLQRLLKPIHQFVERYRAGDEGVRFLDERKAP